MSDFEQLSMFGGDELPAPDGADEPVLTAGTPLEAALEQYYEHLRLNGSSPHTIKAFRSDLNLLGGWAGYDRAVGDFSTQTLNKFLHWMLTERDRPCSPKTYARRVTTLKHFFGYLHAQEVLPRDPSAGVIQKSVSSPLPEVLLSDELARVLAVTGAHRHNPEKPDARPHLLVTLLLQTGIKKGETMALTPEDIVRTNPAEPILWVRYKNPKMRYKERKIALDPAWLTTLEEYLAQRKPEGVIFDCTARNLEYVLRDVANQAGVPQGKLSFETLRWTCAYQDYLAGMDEEKLRQKLGLSRISWRDTSARLEQLRERYEGA
jgi:integrase/recombinase XerD